MTKRGLSHTVPFVLLDILRISLYNTNVLYDTAAAENVLDVHIFLRGDSNGKKKEAGNEKSPLLKQERAHIFYNPLLFRACFFIASKV